MKKTSPRAAAETVSNAVTIDRRRSSERRDGEVVATSESKSAGPSLERRKKVTRRRQIDPTTCERDYTEQEVEFMNALDNYKRKSGRMFPTCSEVLEVINSLGYVKLTPTSSCTSTAMSAASAKPMPTETPVCHG